jgi:hypothetical protein
MPYIEPDRRVHFDELAERVVILLKEDTARGDLNYFFFRVIYLWLKHIGLSYRHMQDYIHGTLDSCKMEMWWRLMRPYEDEAIHRNGDIL